MIKKLITCMLLMCALPALGADFLKNYDGDTLTIQEDQNIVKLRLHEVDAQAIAALILSCKMWQEIKGWAFGAGTITSPKIAGKAKTCAG